jgi:hypothetical protein
MRRLAFVLLALVLLPARANLGDSVAGCTKRYGKPVAFGEASAKNPFGTLVYAAGGYQLIVFLLDNIEVGARVSKIDKTAFSDAEMKTIMDADATSPWTSAPSVDPACLQWERGDKSTVLYDRDKKMLIFTSPAMVTALHVKPPAPPAPPPPQPPPTPAVPAAP